MSSHVFKTVAGKVKKKKKWHWRNVQKGIEIKQTT